SSLSALPRLERGTEAQLPGREGAKRGHLGRSGAVLAGAFRRVLRRWLSWVFPAKGIFHGGSTWGVLRPKKSPSTHRSDLASTRSRYSTWFWIRRHLAKPF